MTRRGHLVGFLLMLANAGDLSRAMPCASNLPFGRALKQGGEGRVRLRPIEGGKEGTDSPTDGPRPYATTLGNSLITRR